jgi:sugar phosphate isomerase/epimerase
MKLSCLPVSLYSEFASGQRSLGAWFRLAAELGLDGADLSVAHITSRSTRYLADLRQQAHNAGVQIAMLATYTDFTHPDATERARQQADLRAWIEAASVLETPMLRVTAGQAHPGVAEADGLEWATHGLMACLAEAHAAGVQLLYENHVRGAVWQYNDFTQPRQRFLEIVQRTAGSDLGILFDSANPLALNDDPIELLQRVQPRVAALHLSDIRRAGAFEPTIIGTGVAPISIVLQIMRKNGFGGWASIEEASRTGEAGLWQAVRNVEALAKRTNG